MQPLYHTSTILTKEEYKKLIRASFSNQKKLLIIICPLMIFMTITSKSRGNRLCIILVAIVSFLWSFYQINQAYKTNKTLQNQLTNYTFYDTYFTAETQTELNKIYYNELNLIIETKTNFYLSRAQKIIYPIIKANCSDDLISFLQNTELKNVLSEQENTFSESVPEKNVSNERLLFEATTAFNVEERYKLQQYVLINRLKMPYILILLTTLIAGHSIFMNEYFFAITWIAVMTGTGIALMSKKAMTFIKIQEQQFHYRFYTDYLQLQTIYGITTYNYKDLHDIVETDSNFYLQISSLQYIVLVKQNCSPELIDYIRQLHKHRK